VCCSGFAVLLLTFAETRGSDVRRVAARDALALENDDVEAAPLHERALLEHGIAKTQPAAHLEEIRADGDVIEARGWQCRCQRPQVGRRFERCPLARLDDALDLATAATRTSRDAVLTLTKVFSGRMTT